MRQIFVHFDVWQKCHCSQLRVRICSNHKNILLFFITKFVVCITHAVQFMETHRAVVITTKKQQCWISRVHPTKSILACGFCQVAFKRIRKSRNHIVIASIVQFYFPTILRYFCSTENCTYEKMLFNTLLHNQYEFNQ